MLLSLSRRPYAGPCRRRGRRPSTDRPMLRWNATQWDDVRPWHPLGTGRLVTAYTVPPLTRMT